MAVISRNTVLSLGYLDVTLCHVPILSLFLSAKMSEILQKSKNRLKIQFAMESDKQNLRLFENMFCSLRYSITRFTVFFVFKEAQIICWVEFVKVMWKSPIRSFRR